MSQFLSIGNPAIFLLIFGIIAFSGVYIIQKYVFVPLRIKHQIEKQELELKNIKLLSLFATASPNPLFRFNADGEILMTNDSGQKLLHESDAYNNNLHCIFQGLKGINLTDLIKNSKTLPLTSVIGGKSFDIILVGIPDLNFGHAYCTDITERVEYAEKIKASGIKLRELTNRLQDASETMKNVISMELHDGVCQTISSIKLTASQIEKYLTPDQRGRDLLINVVSIADGALQELKSLAYQLTPKLLHEFGLIAGIQALIMQIEAANQIKGTFQIIGRESRLSPKMEINIYRIVQELLSNIIKHAHATFFSVQFIFTPDKLTLLVENDGVGFDVENTINKSGLGLLDISERVAYFNGKVTISSEKEKGTETIIDLPIKGEVLNEAL